VKATIIELIVLIVGLAIGFFLAMLLT